MDRWAEWRDAEAFVPAADGEGEGVTVRPGDRVLLREVAPGKFAIVDHEPRALN